MLASRRPVPRGQQGQRERRVRPAHKGQQGAQGAQGAAAKAPVTLDFQHRWNGPAREPLVDQAIEMFEEKHENILVDLTMNLTPGGPGVDGGVPIGKIIAAIAAGSPPDVFMIHGRATIDLARRNALTWIDDYLTRDKRSLGRVVLPGDHSVHPARWPDLRAAADRVGRRPLRLLQRGHAGREGD